MQSVADALRAVIAKVPRLASETVLLQHARGRTLAADVGARIPTLIVKVSGPSPSAGIEVTVDGVKMTTDALGGGWKLNPGNHSVVTSADGFQAAERPVTLAEGRSETLHVTLQPTTVATSGPSAATVLMATGFSVGGVALIVGAVTGGLSIAETDALLERCGGTRCDSDAADDLSSATTLANVSNASFVVGGIGLVIGVVGVVLSVTEPDTAEAAFMPKVSGRGLSWSFR